MRQRMLCWFSCGAASAVASKKTINYFGDYREVVVVNCDTRPSEHPDNYRFSQDCERWFGQPIVYIRNHDYRTVDDVFERERYMSGVHGARCTTELKKLPRHEFAKPEDIHVFGFHSSERQRAIDFAHRNPDLKLYWTLIKLGINKKQCLAELSKAGIEQPVMYRLGFDNNNCPGCVKSKGVWYWDMIRKHFPEVFNRRCEQSRSIGCRLIVVKGKRVFLDELPPGPFLKPKRKENLSCGPECGVQLTFKSTREELGGL